MYKAITLALALSAPAAAITPRGAAAVTAPNAQAALKLRGGTLLVRIHLLPEPSSLESGDQKTAEKLQKYIRL